MDNPNDLTVLGEVAGLTAGDVPNFDTLRARYETDPRLRVDGSLMSYVNGEMVAVAVA